MDALAIRGVRRRFEMSQEQLAAILGVSTMTIIRWEKGTAVPKGVTAQIIKVCVSVSHDERLASNVHRLVRQRTDPAGVLWYILHQVYSVRMRGEEK